ncbi:MAG: hypothetical protein FJZ38_23685 [Candidatus Rokubacteria bacterium]|jgi:hypothetical protein|nr:hypothetical protein [Candidatus Rokubacteria bacterium]
MDAPASSGTATALQRCPACRDKVVVERDTEVVVHNAILRIDRPSGRVTAKCRRCKAWVEVPLKFVG